MNKTVIEIKPDERVAYEATALRMIQDQAVRLIIRQPFFGQLLLGLNARPIWDMPTMGVDGKNLFYNPYFVSHLTAPELCGVICHEVLHLAYLHLFRRKKRHPKKWNAAADFVVNLTVKDEMSMTLPNVVVDKAGNTLLDGILYDQKYTGKLVEEVYDLLPERPEGNSEGNAGGDDGNEWDSFDEHGLHEDVTESDILDRVVRAANAARSQGKLPSSLERWISELTRPQVDWRRYIRGKALDIFNRTDYRPERRSLISGAVAHGMRVRSTWLPGLAGETTQTLVIAVDTSGSINPDILKAFASEIQGCMELADKTYVLTCDAKIHEVVEVDKFSAIFEKVAFKGGGGTDFRPVFTHLEELNIVPAFLVYFTDGYGSFPDDAPSYPVLWAFTKEHSPAPWGDSVLIDGSTEGD